MIYGCLSSVFIYLCMVFASLLIMMPLWKKNMCLYVCIANIYLYIDTHPVDQNTIGWTTRPKSCEPSGCRTPALMENNHSHSETRWRSVKCDKTTVYCNNMINNSTGCTILQLHLASSATAILIHKQQQQPKKTSLWINFWKEFLFILGQVQLAKFWWNFSPKKKKTAMSQNVVPKKTADPINLCQILWPNFSDGAPHHGLCMVCVSHGLCFQHFPQENWLYLTCFSTKLLNNQNEEEKIWEMSKHYPPSEQQHLDIELYKCLSIWLNYTNSP